MKIWDARKIEARGKRMLQRASVSPRTRLKLALTSESATIFLNFFLQAFKNGIRPNPFTRFHWVWHASDVGFKKFEFLGGNVAGRDEACDSHGFIELVIGGKGAGE
jgi:hypothetical protein